MVDRVFTRVGAQDDLAGQRSTFMVEMIETANILRNATPRSLLVLDEIGRGTSTFDGIAVARAVVEQIHDDPRLRCKTLFATHYHELADLAHELAGVTSLQVEVLERGDRVVFLHRVVPGAADRSYGVHVARLAGVPEPVTRRAAAILAELERAEGPRRRRGASANGHERRAGRDRSREGQAEALRRLATIEPLRMSPLDALAELMALVELATRRHRRTGPASGDPAALAGRRGADRGRRGGRAAGLGGQGAGRERDRRRRHAASRSTSRAAGSTLIRVADDGHGIEPDDLPVAFERHATSKLTSDDDLDRIATLGFRGEALPSIAAVADVDCLTRTADEPHAWLLALRGGAPGADRAGHADAGHDDDGAGAVRRAAGPAEVPARQERRERPDRRRWWRTWRWAARTSRSACASTDGASLETPGDGDLAAAMAAVHGRGIAEYLAPIEPDQGDGDRVEVGGCLGWGEATLPTRAGLTLLVNGRWVQSRALSYAVDEAYRTLVQVGRFPIAVLDLTVPPGEVDVNVHPRKSEVRLLHERAAFGAIQRAIRRTLAGFTRAAPRPACSGRTSAPVAGRRRPRPGRPDCGCSGRPAAPTSSRRAAAGIYLVDQHAAHERVLFERIHAAWEGRQERQALLEPAVLDLPPRVAAVARDHLDALDAAGFEVEPFGEGALLTRAVPAALAERDPLGVLGAGARRRWPTRRRRPTGGSGWRSCSPATRRRGPATA